VDVPLLAGAAPFSAGGRNRLSDLRFFDQAGRPVPHLLVDPPQRQPQWTAGALLAIASTEKSSGFEVDLGSMQRIDALSVEGLPAPFLKRLRLEGSGDRQRWTELAREATLFDLPAEMLRQTELPFEPGEFRYLRVTWNDTNSGRMPLPLTARARRVIAAAPPRALTAPLAFIARPSEPGRSRYRLTLPAAGLPIVAIDLAVPGAHVFRSAAIFESRLAGVEVAPAELGRTQLKQVVRDGITAGSLRIPIQPPGESELDLVVEDGTNPPLAIAAVTARFAQLPWIYFEAPAGSVVARYGNPSLTPPQYDLEALRDSIDIGAVRNATWGPPRTVETTASAPAADPLPETGAPLDPGSFKHARAIPASDSTLLALTLDVPVLAGSRGPHARFADVRIVDASGRQVPYLLERRDEPLLLDVKLEPAPAPARNPAQDDRRHQSTYRLPLPFANLPGARLVLETAARVFQRNVTVAVLHPADRQRRDPWMEVIASARWTHADQQTPPPALVLPVQQMDTTELFVTIDEGDNAPLKLSGARLMLPSYRARFYQPAGAALRLVYGREDLTAPRYDLALLAPQVMGAAATEIAAAPATEVERASGATFVSPRLFWIVLGVAVVVLLGLIARLVAAGEGTGHA
jgi:hypothetical protein